MKMIEDLGLLYPNEKSKHKKRFAIYECDCGKPVKIQVASVNNGLTTSCGCYRRKILAETHSKHGLSNTKLYEVWRSINQRCGNPNHKNFKHYMGRGITICEEWKNNFMSFYNWANENGYDDSLQIDRENNDGNYEPANCRWVTSKINNNNRRIPVNWNKSGYIGVTFRKASKKYTSKVWCNEAEYYVGLFKTAKEAAIARNEFIIKNDLPKSLNVII